MRLEGKSGRRRDRRNASREKVRLVAGTRLPATRAAVQRHGSVQFRFDLPIFPGSRQDPKIAAKRAARAAVAAEREATLRQHAAMLESDLAEHERLANAVRRQREVLLPLAREKVELAMAAWRGGKGSLSEVAAAQGLAVV
ncbi:TolC family protein [Thiobacter aerophilum]|uniref:TolC family protein n=1 Tax=Thiobacter aerophilum TaxID=3121275 RepID=UPI003D3016AE